MIGYTNCHTAVSQKQFNPQLYEEAVYEKKDKPSVPKKGTKIKDNDGSTYIVTSGKGKTPTVQYTDPKSTAKGTVTIPAMVKVDGVSYRVTSIADNAFYGVLMGCADIAVLILPVLVGFLAFRKAYSFLTSTIKGA